MINNLHHMYTIRDHISHAIEFHSITTGYSTSDSYATSPLLAPSYCLPPRPHSPYCTIAHYNISK